MSVLPRWSATTLLSVSSTLEDSRMDSRDWKGMLHRIQAIFRFSSFIIFKRYTIFWMCLLNMSHAVRQWSLTNDHTHINIHIWNLKCKSFWHKKMYFISFIILNFKGNMMLNLCTLYELESSYAMQKKIGLLGMVSQYSSDSFNINMLKL